MLLYPQEEIVVPSSVLPHNMCLLLIAALAVMDPNLGLPLSLCTAPKLLYCRNYGFVVPMLSAEALRKKGRNGGRERRREGGTKEEKEGTEKKWI